mmetsp:Transcript_75886/g.205176  ORF Transcript_75886/g.205176 Transcript_75886/m.205176 type:complete len:268 (-) Transcript_75886:270-1073(-)
MISGNSSPSIARDARLLVDRWNRGGKYRARLIMNFSLENKAADMGLFLQQIQQVPDPSIYEFLLKVHSKRAEAWRCQMLTSLCGSKDQVKHILDRLGQQQDLGLLGPWALTWRYDDMVDPVKVQGSFDQLAKYAFLTSKGAAFMRGAWDSLYENRVAMPPRDQWAMVGGNCFWARSAPLLQNPRLLGGISRWLAIWEFGYDSNCRQKRACLDAYGLERVIPTMIAHEYALSVAEAPNKHVDNIKHNHACRGGDCMSSCGYALPTRSV